METRDDVAVGDGGARGGAGDEGADAGTANRWKAGAKSTEVVAVVLRSGTRRGVRPFAEPDASAT